MEAAEHVLVEVAYALPHRQRLLSVRVPAGATVAVAVRASGLLDEFPEVDLARSKVGIFGRRVSLDQAVRDGDRVEIYRELIADPKAARRARAERSGNDG